MRNVYPPCIILETGRRAELLAEHKMYVQYLRVHHVFEFMHRYIILIYLDSLEQTEECAVYIVYWFYIDGGVLIIIPCKQFFG